MGKAHRSSQNAMFCALPVQSVGFGNVFRTKPKIDTGRPQGRPPQPTNGKWLGTMQRRDPLAPHPVGITRRQSRIDRTTTDTKMTCCRSRVLEVFAADSDWHFRNALTIQANAIQPPFAQRLQDRVSTDTMRSSCSFCVLICDASDRDIAVFGLSHPRPLRAAAPLPAHQSDAPGDATGFPCRAGQTP